MIRHRFDFFHFLNYVISVNFIHNIQYDYEITDARTSLFYAES